MSVQMIDLKIYDAVYEKATSYQYNKVCNINFCQTLRLDDKTLQKHVANWCTLNELSYIHRYNEVEKVPELSEFLNFRSNKSINAYQMLKYLQAIDYQIEPDTIKHGTKENLPFHLEKSYQLLKSAIIDMLHTIVASQPEYEEAKWSDI
jgi:hypothetical protein